MMTKQELVSAIAEATGVAKKDTEAVIKGFTDIIAKELKDGGKVQMTGFGSFEVTERGERKGINPQTGEEITIAASKRPRFKAGKKFVEAVQ